MPINKERLISLAVWAAGEDAKRRLGLPSEWDQSSWLTKTTCGTACCIAGKVALEDGGKPMHDDFGGFRMWVTFLGHDDEMISVPEHARRALGLGVYQGDRLFSSSNDLDDVLRIIGELIGTDTVEASP